MLSPFRRRLPLLVLLGSLLVVLIEGLGLGGNSKLFAMGSGSLGPSQRLDPLRNLVVLAYHDIAEPAQALMPDFAVTPAHFQEQIAWLQEHGRHFVSVDQVIAARAGRAPLPSNPVLVSFDDGFRSVYTTAFPVLKRYKIPAVLGLVGSWLTPESGPVHFGDDLVGRERFLSWEQLRTLVASGLIEPASHTYDLHRGIPGNPQGNSEPAVTTRLYGSEQGYESETAYRHRLRADLAQNSSTLERQLGRRPRVVVWPYGRYNQTASAVASELGMPVGLSLDDGANGRKVPLTALRRILMTQEMGGTSGLAKELDFRRRDLGDTARAVKVMHVDLDTIHDPDPKQTERNLKLLLERINAMGVNTVYLQAFADPQGRGSAEALYFPNRHMPVKEDLFNHVAWEIRTRTRVRRLYAWMPVLAFELPALEPTANLIVETQPSHNGHLSMGYHRLSPFAPKAMQVVSEIYEDLSRRATFDGLIFHDDATLSDYEDASPPALAQYRAWGLPTDLAAIRASDPLLGRWTTLKTEALQTLTLDLARTVAANQPQLRTARNLYAQVVLNPHAEAWFSQSLDYALRDYDFTAVEAMPYMEQAKDAHAFFVEMVKAVKEKPQGLHKVVFELQSTDWRTGKDIASTLLASQFQTLYQLGAQHLGYYPDSPFRGNPDPATLKPVFDGHSSEPQLKAS
jgi:biofilm PGA synthesis lipoprotein PgaB